jgi:hypothetical protein
MDSISVLRWKTYQIGPNSWDIRNSFSDLAQLSRFFTWGRKQSPISEKLFEIKSQDDGLYPKSH